MLMTDVPLRLKVCLLSRSMVISAYQHPVPLCHQYHIQPICHGHQDILPTTLPANLPSETYSHSHMDRLCNCHHLQLLGLLHEHILLLAHKRVLECGDSI